MVTDIENEVFSLKLKTMAKNNTALLLEMLDAVKDDIELYKRNQLDKIIDEDFKRFDSVFKALA